MGLELSVHEGNGPIPLKPSPNADQNNPRRNYVYAHVDSTGKIFYVGKGEGKRAWSRERHMFWHQYVEKHLNGNYGVLIIQDNLSAEEAEEVEAEWIAQCSQDIVNCINMGRATDFEACDQVYKLRNANRVLIQQAKSMEKVDLEKAVTLYVNAIQAIREYAFINCEKGLIGQLLDENIEEFGRSGEIEALDRLTMCLTKLGRAEEAVQRVANYITTYRRDQYKPAFQRITKRIQKALARARQDSDNLNGTEQRPAPNRPQ